MDGNGKEVSPAKHVAASHRQVPSGCDLVLGQFQVGSYRYRSLIEGLYIF